MVYDLKNKIGFMVYNKNYFLFVLFISWSYVFEFGIFLFCSIII
jgi:hypothetical protein